MAEHKLPDSLELLLDTMCNTFGGVMFITISMVIMVSVVSKMLTGGSSAELERQMLEEERRRIAELEAVAEEQNAESQTMQSRSTGYASGDREAVEQLRERMREAARLEERHTAQLQELKRLQNEVSRRTAANAAELERINRSELEAQVALREQEQRSELLAQEQEAIRRQRAEVRPRKIRFAKNEATRLRPYDVILCGDALHRLGVGFDSSAEVEVRRNGNTLTLIPVRGIPVSEEIGKAEFSRLFPGFDRNRCFVRCFVHPDSMETFVGLRQMFRAFGMKLEWMITEEYLLFLTDNPKYRVSD